MNLNLWDALMKNDFVFDRESYLTLRQSCYHLLQQNVPELLELRDEEVVDFFHRTGESVAEYYDAGARFDSVDYLCQLESLENNTSEQRKRVYLHAVHCTFEQRMVMWFVAMMGVYVSRCDEDDDFWEPYGLSGRYLNMDEGFRQVVEENCIAPLSDVSLCHFDRRMAASLSALYSLAVTLIGADEFGLHLHNFFHYIRQNDKLEMIAWVYGHSGKL